MNELTDAIIEELREISEIKGQNLARSMLNRCIEVLEKSGGPNFTESVYS